MKSQRVFSVLACTSIIAASTALLLVACAEGAVKDDAATASPVQDKGVEPPTSTSPTLPAPDTNASIDGGTEAGTDADSGPAADPDPAVCQAKSGCSSALKTGDIRGDMENDKVTLSGATSAWFSVPLVEADSGMVGKSLRLAATLESPPGTNFDLYVYAPKPNAIECTSVKDSSMSKGTSDSVAVEVGELPDPQSGVALANGADDSSLVTIEVRHVSGPCDLSKTWTLTIAGNE